jgi:hypothetical protein
MPQQTIAAFEHDHTELVRSSHWYAIQGRMSHGMRHRKRFIALVPLSRYKDPKTFKLHQYGTLKSSNYFDVDRHQWYNQ